MHREQSVQSGAALCPPLHPRLSSSACRRVGRAHHLLSPLCARSSSLDGPPLLEAPLGHARRARTRGRAVCVRPPNSAPGACAASLRSARPQRRDHARRQARQRLMCAPGAPASAGACPSGGPLATPDLPAAASRRRARAAGGSRRPPPRAPRAPARPASPLCAAAPLAAAAPGSPAGDGAAASELAAAAGGSRRAPGAAARSDAAGAGALGGRLLSARRGGHATRSTSCEKVSRPRSAPYTVVACRARRGGPPRSWTTATVRAGRPGARGAPPRARGPARRAPAASTWAPRRPARTTRPSAGSGSDRTSRRRRAAA